MTSTIIWRTDFEELDSEEPEGFRIQITELLNHTMSDFLTHQLT